MSTVIQIENLSKKYRIKRNRGKSYDTIREAAVQRIAHFISKRPETTREEFWALKNVFLDVKDGEKVGIIGRNGAGKSTLLKLLSRVTEPTTGKIVMTGRVSSLLEVGTGFHPELTGRENIFLNGAILGMCREEIRKKFGQIVEFAEINDFLDIPVKRYSSGMSVRLAFSVAAHLEPEILIIDEVLAVGDSQFQKKCLAKMEEVSQGGRTILVVSHNMGTIQQLCERVIVLEQGQKVFDGNVEDGIAYYLKSIGQNQLFVDASHIRRKSRITGEITFLDIEVLDNRNLLYRFNQALQIRVHLKAHQDMRCFYMRARIRGFDERPIGTAFNDIPFSVKAGEDKYYVLTVDTNGITPGRYFLDLGLLKEVGLPNLNGIDLLNKVICFEIIFETSKGVNMFWRANWGFFKLNKLEVIEVTETTFRKNE